MNNYPNGPQQPYQQPTTGQYPQQPYPQQQGYPQPQPGYPQMPPQQPIQPPKKKRKGLIVLGVIIGALVLCGVIATASKGGSTSTTTTTSSSSSNSTNSSSNSTQQQPAKPQTWTTTHNYSGDGAKKTESFTVGNDWKIKWSCNPGSIGMDAPLFISVYNTDGSIFDPGVNTTCKNGQDTTGETQEHQGGTFYLDINAGISWSLTIQELK